MPKPVGYVSLHGDQQYVTGYNIYVLEVGDEKVIGARAYSVYPTEIEGLGRYGLVMEIVISPEGELDRHSLLLTVQNNHGKWEVVGAELSSVNYN